MWVHWIKNLKIYQHGLLFIWIGIGLFVCGHVLLFIGKENTFIFKAAQFLKECGILPLLIGSIEFFIFLLSSYGRNALSMCIKDIDERYFAKVGYTALILAVLVFSVIDSLR